MFCSVFLGTGSLHAKTGSHDAEQRDDERASHTGSVREIRAKHGKNGSGNVNRNCHELRGAVGVVEVLDDGREKQANAVQRTHNLRIVSNTKHEQLHKKSLTPQ